LDNADPGVGGLEGKGKLNAIRNMMTEKRSEIKETRQVDARRSKEDLSVPLESALPRIKIYRPTAWGRSG
jgi:hypothetical protein